MGKTILELKNVKKTYPNGFQAIFGMDLKINEGEFVVLVGPSGCGKTTTIRMIAGLERLSTGQLELKGRNITDLPSRKRNVSMVFQNYALFPHLTVKENIIFTLKTKRVARDIVEKKVKWVADILNLKYVLNRRPAQLSGGQRQRVALGRAMVAEPTLFLMDEPLSNLDAKLRSVMRSTIRKLHDELKTTSIYVTHDQIEAMTMADKIVVMSDGFIQQIGTPDEVFMNPANLFVANFIGNPSINLINGKMSGKQLMLSMGESQHKYNLANKKLLRKPMSNDIVLGIRPQHIKLVSKKTTSSFAYKVEYMEVLGAETIVFCNNGLKFVIPVEQKPKKGETVYLDFDVKKIHLFDKKTGVSLTSTINEPTMNSIKTFLSSQKLIEKRTAIMEKAKNKKSNVTLYQRGERIFKNVLWPQEIMINPEYSTLQDKLRELKFEYKDKKRVSSPKINQTKSEIKTTKLQIKDITQTVRKTIPTIRKYEKLKLKISKISNSLKENKKASFKNIDNSVKQLRALSRKITTDFDVNLYYNIDDIKTYISKAEELLKSKK